MSQSPAHLRIRPSRWVLPTVLTLGCVLAGLPAVSASAVAGGVITGTVTFHEDDPDRTLEVYRETAPGTWTEDESRETTVAYDGSYSVRVPAGEPVKLRVAYGEQGYWYGDGFDAAAATPVEAPAGSAVGGIDLELPVPVEYSGRLLDRADRPVSGRVVPTVNTDGASRPLLAEPVLVDASGEYRVFLPAKHGGSWYEAGILGFAGNDTAGAWLGGGEESEPNFYLNPLPSEVYVDQDIHLPVGSAQSAGPSDTPSSSVSRLRATRSPIIRGRSRRGATLHTTSGRFNLRPATLRYQWLRNGRPIRGARASAYRLRRADVRKHIRVRVTATRSGTTVRATSARTRTIRRR